MRCYGFFVFFKQKTAYEMRISDWSSDVCSSDLGARHLAVRSLRAVLIDDVEQHVGAVQGFLALAGHGLLQKCGTAPDPRAPSAEPGMPRSEARRVGNEWVRTFRSRWSPDH